MEKLSIISEITKSVGEEIHKNLKPSDITRAIFGKGGLIPIVGKEFWVGSYYISINFKK